MHLQRTAKRCGMLVAILSLASLRLASGQQIDPIIGPTVRITSPANHAVFYAPVDIPIFAYAVAIDNVGVDTPTNVEFFAGTMDLGRGFDLGSTTVRPPIGLADFVTTQPILRRAGSVYCLVWTNAPAGSYALTAVRAGSFGLSRTSAPVNLTILAATTNSNPTDVVSIVATDPIAIAGTNSWVWLGMTNAAPAWTNWPPRHWQSFTNWGPKDALFTVRRFGDVSAAVTVNYNIGGNATNGVDYAGLPGYVTIPAGGAYALIPIVPTETNTYPKTVLLALAADTNMPPDYVVGIPSHATALILHDWLSPWAFMLPDGEFHFNASGTNGGPDGAWFSIQNSSDLQNWSSVSTNQIFQSSIDFIDPDAPNNSLRFYRTLPVTNTPAN